MSKNTNIDLVTHEELGVQLLEALMIEAPIEEIRTLVERGADVNTQDNNNDDQTLIHYACWMNNAELAAFLIDQGADVNIQDKNGQTPLYQVCHENNTELAAFLMQRGADVNIQNDFGQTTCRSPEHLTPPFTKTFDPLG
ncbi:MAG: ankyrin repeat domain-containing protein [Alphaproteobacteria bacterium]|nr:ankyrin repeat domain-containing protein [Alphaproteobacteria bacterium]